MVDSPIQLLAFLQLCSDLCTQHKSETEPIALRTTDATSADTGDTLTHLVCVSVRD